MGKRFLNHAAAAGAPAAFFAPAWAAHGLAHSVRAIFADRSPDSKNIYRRHGLCPCRAACGALPGPIWLACRTDACYSLFIHKKRGKTHAWRLRLSPETQRPCGHCSAFRADAPPAASTIMKRRDLCKPNISKSLQAEISSQYHREALAYQHSYNSSHDGDRIWRHMLYRRTFRFLRGGRLVSVTVEIVRFIHARTRRTFTFYGSLFLPRVRYPLEFVRSASSPSDAEACFYVSSDTVRRWRSSLPGQPGPQDHDSAPSRRPSGMV